MNATKFKWIAQGWSRAIMDLCHDDASTTACGTISVIIIYGDLGWIMYEQQGGLCLVYQTLGQQSFIKMSQAIKNMMDLIWNVLVQREARTHNGWFSQKIGLTIKSWQSWDLQKHLGTLYLNWCTASWHEFMEFLEVFALKSNKCFENVWICLTLLLQKVEGIVDSPHRTLTKLWFPFISFFLVFFSFYSTGQRATLKLLRAKWTITGCSWCGKKQHSSISEAHNLCIFSTQLLGREYAKILNWVPALKSDLQPL